MSARSFFTTWESPPLLEAEEQGLNHEYTIAEFS